MYITSSEIVGVLALILGVYGGYRFQALSVSGGIVALLISFLIVLGTGIKGLFLIGAFFVTSSFWSRFKRERKRSADERNEKGGKRDGYQVLANGLLPAIASIGFAFIKNDLFLFIFIAALATANSDTWASEIGSLSRKKPVHLLSLKQVEAGTSGAMSLLGTIAAFFGALLIGIVSYFLWNEVSLTIALLIALAGFLGNLVDTFLGATVQVTYYCPSCYLVTEKRKHCGMKTQYKQGLRLFNNEVVNFLAIMLGSLVILAFI
ncbi:DUF92 domain-containing protein [Calidifontibacillus oryziterrae]|uniref:DUF92 domain-containing protein n=1 Tax=Calidifontibacillus oryziterrae TaxID=1191699 RepID=UPI0002D61BB6|nr:DUF92 domain-containing protein [Calidifontibacillus oryziterrae]